MKNRFSNLTVRTNHPFKNQASTMKNMSSQHKLYFSAYPLKAVSSENPELSAEKSSLHVSNKSKAFGRIRVHPMANPYKGQVKPSPRVKPSNLSEDSTQNTNGWYGNYE
jgi:hypothetical protein